MKNQDLHLLPILLLLGVLCSSFLACSGDKEPTFPKLRPGAYDGTLSFNKSESLEALSGKTIGIFLEKEEGVTAVQASIFYLLQSSTAYELIASASEEEPAFQPLRITFAGQSILLASSNQKKIEPGSYRGNILSEAGELQGSWHLYPSVPKDSADNENSLSFQVESESFDTWLALQSRYQIALGNLRLASEEAIELEKEVESLQALVDAPESLQSKAAERLEKIKSEIAEKQQKVSELDEAIEKGLKAIKQVQRITKLGRSLELSRRVASRESQWYQVNWSDGSSNESLESKFARKMNIDLRLLDRKSTEALELERLKSQIAAEKAKIRNLRKQRKRQAEDVEKEKKQPWWKRWDTVIG